MINQEKLLESEFKKIYKKENKVIHWISRQNLDIICDVSYLLNFQSLHNQISQFLNSTKVDNSIDDNYSEIEYIPYNIPIKEKLEAKYSLESNSKYLSIFKSFKSEYIQLAADNEYEEALRVSKSSHEKAEVLTIAFLNGHFDKVPSIEKLIHKDFILPFIYLIKIVELIKNDLFEESKQELNKLLALKKAHIGTEIVLALNNKKPWESYPFID
ncbi:hypothetical protein [Aureibacter tunicatorum]|uniref:Uncharacterized protein n=1 Tax=Aureibacter tunicatorum TaxID=866807 RepID=A0AAE3XPF1_9BACT|nr:hypothetical protein [Aureibacter tunicatorum]MDR6239521.1 hypothetical protein [Aureibacter tunicatorum]